MILLPWWYARVFPRCNHGRLSGEPFEFLRQDQIWYVQWRESQDYSICSCNIDWQYRSEKANLWWVLGQLHHKIYCWNIPRRMHSNGYQLLAAMKHFLRCRIYFRQWSRHNGYVLDQPKLRDIPQGSFLSWRRLHTQLINYGSSALRLHFGVLQR